MENKEEVYGDLLIAGGWDVSAAMYPTIAVLKHSRLECKYDNDMHGDDGDGDGDGVTIRWWWYEVMIKERLPTSFPGLGTPTRLCTSLPPPAF